MNGKHNQRMSMKEELLEELKKIPPTKVLQWAMLNLSKELDDDGLLMGAELDIDFNLDSKSTGKRVHASCHISFTEHD